MPMTSYRYNSHDKKTEYPFIKNPESFTQIQKFKMVKPFDKKS